MADRAVIVAYLIAGKAWSQGEPPTNARPGSERWKHSDGQMVTLPPADEWDTVDVRPLVHQLQMKIADADRVPLSQVTGVQGFDPKSDPVLHTNGRGRKHYGAFRTAEQERQERHIRREHSSDPDSARRTAGTDSLTEAHEWLHDRFDR